MKPNLVFMRSTLTLLFTLNLCLLAYSQVSTTTLLEDLNRSIDHAVVQKDMVKLQTSYGDDFVFTHGSGVVDSKESWLQTIQKSKDHFASREHDSTQVELHSDVAIMTGRLMVTKEKGTRYGLRYVRVYALRKERWLLISHRTIKEWHY